jgi:hypothetical protein
MAAAARVVRSMFFRTPVFEERNFRLEALAAGFGLFDSCCQGQHFFQPCGVEHAENARRDTGEREMDVLVTAIHLVIDNLAHSGGVHEGNAAEIEDGVAGRVAASKQGSQGRHAMQGHGPNEAKDDGSGFPAGNRLDLEGGIENHCAISV